MKKSIHFTLMNLLVSRGYSRRIAYFEAAQELRRLEDAGTPVQVIKAQKVDGTVTTRVVTRDFSSVEFKGTGRPAPADSVLYVDVVKMIRDENPIISFKVDRIISVAA